VAWLLAALALALPVAAYLLVATGRVTPRFGVGRSRHRLGPLSIRIAAPPGVVSQVIEAPYSERPPAATRGHVRVLERRGNAVLAEHRTEVRGGLTAITVEWVTFESRDRVTFELVRGPVPLVEEEFVLNELPDGTTELAYRGELGADLWAIGRAWGRLVAARWDEAVARSLDEIKRAAESRSRRGDG
jgi:hypothetical protein